MFQVPKEKKKKATTLNESLKENSLAAYVKTKKKKLN